MNADQMVVGARVRLVNTVHDDGPSPGKIFDTIPAGKTGVVVAVFPDAIEHFNGEHFAEVRFDERIATLDDWDNVMHVWREDGDVLPGDFTLID